MDGAATQCGTDNLRTDFMQGQCQGTDTQRRSQCFGILDTVGTLDDSFTGCDYGVYTRYADKFIVIVDTDSFVVFIGTLGSFRKSLCTLGIKLQLCDIFAISGIILLYTALGVGNRRTLEYDTVLFFQLINRILQFIFTCGRIVAVAGIAVIIRLASRILLASVTPGISTVIRLVPSL